MLIEFLLIEFEKIVKHLFWGPGFLFSLEKFNKLPSLKQKTNPKLYAIRFRVGQLFTIFLGICITRMYYVYLLYVFQMYYVFL